MQNDFTKDWARFQSNPQSNDSHESANSDSQNSRGNDPFNPSGYDYSGNPVSPDLQASDSLRFLKTMEIGKFKALQNAEKIELLLNQRTGKCFFSFGTGTGAVCSSYPESPLEKPVVSEVSSSETGETFFLLHNKVQSPNVLETL